MLLLALTLLNPVSAVAAEQGYAGENNRPAACRFDMARGAMTLGVGGGGVRTVAPGEAVRIDPRWTPYPSAWDEVPLRCLDGWRVSNPAVARLTRDRRVLTIAADAPEGALVTLAARYRGHPVTQAYRVIRPVVSPLVGVWTQGRAECPNDDGLFELVFARDGSFTVTFATPLHNRIDYRGRWQARGGELVLDGIAPAASGGALPGDMARATGFGLGADGLLRFAVPWHGSLEGRGACRGAFRRVR